MPKRHRRNTFHIPEDELRQHYLVDRRTDADIASIYGCGAYTIWKRRQQHGIPTTKAQPGRGRDLTKPLLEDLYLGQKLTHEQIAQRLGVSEDTVRTYIHRHGIPKLTPMLRRDQPSILEDDEATGLVIGCVFGDGYLATNRATVRLELKHAVSQGQWARWKARRLSRVLDMPYIRTVKPSNAQGWNVQDQVRAISAAHPDLATMRPWFYAPEGRWFAPEALARMTRLSFATWMLDDGNLSSRRIYTLYGMRYPEVELRKAAAAIAERFGLTARVRHHRDGMFVLKFPAFDSPAISALIRDEVGVLPGMEHKLLPT